MFEEVHVHHKGSCAIIQIVITQVCYRASWSSCKFVIKQVVNHSKLLSCKFFITHVCHIIQVLHHACSSSCNFITMQVYHDFFFIMTKMMMMAMKATATIIAIAKTSHRMASTCVCQGFYSFIFEDIIDILLDEKGLKINIHNAKCLPCNLCSPPCSVLGRLD